LPSPHPLLLAALRAAPRRYRLPPLPADAVAARAQGIDASLALAIDAARRAHEAGEPAPADARSLFLEALAAFLREALAPAGGDPAYQALLLQWQEPKVREFVQLSAQQGADRRAVRSAVDAVAHPGKLRGRTGPASEALAQLHALAAAADWQGLQQALRSSSATATRGPGTALTALADSPALQHLVRHAALFASDPVQRYRSLCERRGPLAGSAAAGAQGRASARTGAEAEARAVQALRRIAALLDARTPQAPAHRVVQGLRPLRGFPGAAGKAKDEWDAALLRGEEIVLLAEVKAAPAAAAADLPRLLRGLQRLAQAAPGQSHAFASRQGEVRVQGASLAALAPHGRALPQHVVYLCSAPVEAQPAILGAAAKSVLAVEPASLAFALRLARGQAASHEELAPVWEALAHAPRLRAALHQVDTAQAAREAMIDPADLLAWLEAGATPTVP
jgi:hypothetical protein